MILRAALEQVRHEPVYAGHLSDGSSIQKHSAGSNYPFIVAIDEVVDAGLGFARVINSMNQTISEFAYPLDDKARRMKAYELAYDAADVFATGVRLGVVKP